MRECFRNLNQTLQLEYTKLGLKEKLRGRRMSIPGTQKFQNPCRKAKLQTAKNGFITEWMEKVNPIRLLEVLPTSGMSCHKTWGLQGAQKEAAFHFSRLIFTFFPSTDLLLKCSQQRKLRTGNEPQQRLTPPLGQSKETSSLVQVSQLQSEGRRLRRCLAVHLTNPWRLRRLCPDLINVIHCQTSVRSVLFWPFEVSRIVILTIGP